MESYKEAQKNRDLKRRLWSGKCTEEDLLNKGYIKVKKVSNYVYDEIVIFCKVLDKTKSNETRGLLLSYYSPENEMILFSKFYEEAEIVDIEDSLEMIQKIFKPSLSDVINQLTKIVSEKVTKSS